MRTRWDNEFPDLKSPSHVIITPMSDRMLPHLRVARAFAVLLLLLATGPESVWIGLRASPLSPNPGAPENVAALILPPTFPHDRL
jgi:hypothetical protein